MNAEIKGVWIGWIKLGREWEADLRAAGCGDPPQRYEPMRFNPASSVWEMCCFRDENQLLHASKKFGFPVTTFTAVPES